ncbi:MAG: CoB--CoM heterodisulfide reductase iron-sulfur subunit A family protein [Candidatus Methanoplasma sp.]|nr:CoB--CoM heterodisulfide reductase iron-sulfur subunit A family protein [Candidatus Methanoplasma sp.]
MPFSFQCAIGIIGGKDLTKSALVIGGGIAGIQASLDLADRDIHVYLVERLPTIGGTMCRLDKTFPTNDCSACILSPKMADCIGHPNIDTLTHHEVVKVEGKEGDFKVTLKKKARYVDPDSCTACGDCIAKCPSKGIPDQFEYGLATRKAIYIPHAQAVPRVAIIDAENCRMIQNGKCGVCAKICGKKAINYEDKDVEVVVEVGSVIAAAGFQPWEATVATEYGYGRFKNVVTALEFERMMCASGPDRGHIKVPSSGEDPKKIAFIQCCGSRSEKDGWKKYCSSVCCMYATKQAMITKEHADVQEDIFFMDIRSYGKEFEAYINRGQKEYGINMHRAARVSNVEEDPETKKLTVNYTDADGNGASAEYDIVVLSIGLNPPNGAEELSKTLGIELNQYGFCKTTVFNPLGTTRKGVFVTGAFAAPKDIPTSVAEASGSAAKAGAYIVDANFEPCKPKQYPPEKDVEGKEPRVGVWVCHCGINIGSVVDVPAVAEYAKGLPHVVLSEQSQYACAQDCLEAISAAIREKDLNRVVVASCTPRTHEPLFREACRDGGLNKYLFNMANIRDQCSWIHMHAAAAATEKAKDLLRMAIAKAVLLEPLVGSEIPVTNSAAVVGGGITGMNAALDIAAQGFEVHIIEREKELGGFARNFHHREDGKEVSAYLKELVEKVEKCPKIKVHKGAHIKDIPGFVGNFKVQLSDGKELPVGAVLFAVGAAQYKPVEYGYGKDGKVLTLLEAEKKIAEGKLSAKNVAFVQCVGSRSDDVKYCSRVCCAGALRNAIQLKMNDPTVSVSILHKDVRTYGFREELYNKASSLGVKFLRYRDGDKLPAYDGSVVKAYDTTLGRDVEIPVDALVLSAGMAPVREEKEELAKMVKVPISKDGFFFEAHQKLRPVDFATEGVYVAGSAHWPKFMDECIAQASGAAARMLTIISKKKLVSEGIVAVSNPDLCDGCGVCEGCCDYNAINIVVGPDGRLKSDVNPGLCKGCGSCVASCPAGAMEQRGFRNKQIIAEIDALLDYPGV